jgi:hypothetical protein
MTVAFGIAQRESTFGMEGLAGFAGNFGIRVFHGADDLKFGMTAFTLVFVDGHVSLAQTGLC